MSSQAIVIETATPEGPCGARRFSPGSVAGRGSGIGAASTLVLVSAILLAVPAATIPSESRPFIVWGAVVGAGVGALGNWIVARGALRRVGGPEASADFVRSIVLDFVLQVFAVVAGTMCLYLLQLKFQEFAAFGATLAGAAVLFRAPGTVLVSRALTQRAQAARSTAPSASPASEDPNQEPQS